MRSLTLRRVGALVVFALIAPVIPTAARKQVSGTDASGSIQFADLGLGEVAGGGIHQG